MENKLVSTWKGSEVTSDLIRKQIFDRFGEEVANNYDPKSNCLTYNQWLEHGYQVKKGEKALKSFIIIEKKDKDGDVIKKYPKRINLFYIKQVEQVGSSS